MGFHITMTVHSFSVKTEEDGTKRGSFEPSVMSPSDSNPSDHIHIGLIHKHYMLAPAKQPLAARLEQASSPTSNVGAQLGGEEMKVPDSEPSTDEKPKAEEKKEDAMVHPSPSPSLKADVSPPAPKPDYLIADNYLGCPEVQDAIHEVCGAGGLEEYSEQWCQMFGEYKDLCEDLLLKDTSQPKMPTVDFASLLGLCSYQELSKTEEHDLTKMLAKARGIEDSPAKQLDVQPDVEVAQKTSDEIQLEELDLLMSPPSKPSETADPSPSQSPSLSPMSVTDSKPGYLSFADEYLDSGVVLKAMSDACHVYRKSYDEYTKLCEDLLWQHRPRPRMPPFEFAYLLDLCSYEKLSNRTENNLTKILEEAKLAIQ